MKTLLAAMALAVFAFTVSPAAGQGADAPAAPSAEEKLVYVKMVTSMGDIYLELNKEKAPISVENFMKYVEKGHYEGTIFHRVMAGFMIQGGGFTPDMQQKPTDKGIKNEWQNGLKNKKGTIAMARVGGNAESGTAQFFINVVDNDFLDRPQPDGAGYAVFGKVVSGMDAVEKIKGVKTGNKARMPDVPVETVSITKVTKTTKEEADKAAGEKK
ncbi:MAG: peptidylprolyl isomerase [Phycisphaerales bacterium]